MIIITNKYGEIKETENKIYVNNKNISFCIDKKRKYKDLRIKLNKMYDKNIISIKEISNIFQLLSYRSEDKFLYKYAYEKINNNFNLYGFEYCNKKDY